MVIAVFIWLYISFICFAVGQFTLDLIRNAIGDSEKYHFSLVTILGLVVVTIVSSIISLFFRLSWEVNMLFLLFSLAYYFIRRDAFVSALKSQFHKLSELKPLTWFVLGSSLLIAAVYSAMPTANFDFGLYHMTTIKWISNYAAVPGLGNIHGRLAFNSSWYILSALFSFSFLKGFAFYDVSPYLYLLVSIYGAQGIQRIMKGNRSLVELVKACFVLPVIAILPFLDAPATDLASNYFIWLIAVLFLIKIERKTIGKFDANTTMIFLFGAFVCTVKLSAIPIMLIPAYLLLKQWKSMRFKGVSLVILFCLITITPWVARNVVLSGYLVYPFEKIDVFNVDWKMPLEEVAKESAIVKQYGKYPNLPVTQEAVEYSLELAGDPFMSWFPAWFKYKSWVMKLILLLLPIGFIGLSGFVIFDLTRNRFKKLSFDFHFILLFGLMLFGTAFCFYLGPSLRYSYGFILFFSILLFAVCFYAIAVKKEWSILNLLLTGIIVLSLLLPVFKSAKIMAVDLMPNNYLVYPHVSSHGELETISFNGFDIYKPMEGYFCWDAPLPCAALPHSGQVHLRTGDIKDGYKFVGPY